MKNGKIWKIDKMKKCKIVRLSEKEKWQIDKMKKCYIVKM